MRVGFAQDLVVVVELIELLAEFIDVIGNLGGAAHCAGIIDGSGERRNLLYQSAFHVCRLVKI